MIGAAHLIATAEDAFNPSTDNMPLPGPGMFCAMFRKLLHPLGGDRLHICGKGGDEGDKYMLSHGAPCHATPRHATPRHATPRHAKPCRTMPKQSKPSTSRPDSMAFCCLRIVCERPADAQSVVCC